MIGEALCFDMLLEFCWASEVNLMHAATSRVISISLWNSFGNTAADPDSNFIFGVLFIIFFFPYDTFRFF